MAQTGSEKDQTSSETSSLFNIQIPLRADPAAAPRAAPQRVTSRLPAQPPPVRRETRRPLYPPRHRARTSCRGPSRSPLPCGAADRREATGRTRRSTHNSYRRYLTPPRALSSNRLRRPEMTCYLKREEWGRAQTRASRCARDGSVRRDRFLCFL